MVLFVIAIALTSILVKITQKNKFVIFGLVAIALFILYKKTPLLNKINDLTS